MDLEKFSEAVHGPLTWYQKVLLRNAATGQLILNRPRHALQSLMVCDYASVEYGMLRSLCGAIGPRAPKRKRRKRLAKKIKQRGGMLKTCGIVQSYFDAWPEMRFWWGR